MNINYKNAHSVATNANNNNNNKRVKMNGTITQQTRLTMPPLESMSMNGMIVSNHNHNHSHSHSHSHSYTNNRRTHKRTLSEAISSDKDATEPQSSVFQTRNNAAKDDKRERNRLAAQKARLKKKARLANLQKTVDEFEMKVDILTRLSHFIATDMSNKSAEKESLQRRLNALISIAAQNNIQTPLDCIPLLNSADDTIHSKLIPTVDSFFNNEINNEATAIHSSLLQPSSQPPFNTADNQQSSSTTTTTMTAMMATTALNDSENE